MSRTIGTRFSAPRLFGGLAVLSAGLFLAGCGGDGGDPAGPGPVPGSGSFSVTVSGAGSLTASGTALAQAINDQWQVAMFSSSSTIDIIIFRGSGGRPGPGTYAMTGGTRAEVTVNSAGFLFSGGSVSGTLTVDSSSANRVSGSFDFVAEENQSGSKITLTGTFDAVQS